jgi:hypothetical protein
MRQSWGSVLDPSQRVSWGISSAESCLPVSTRGRIRVASERPLFWCTDSSWLSPECLSSVRRMGLGCLRFRLHLCIRSASTCPTSNLPLVYTHLYTHVRRNMQVESLLRYNRMRMCASGFWRWTLYTATKAANHCFPESIIHQRRRTDNVWNKFSDTDVKLGLSQPKEEHTLMVFDKKVCSRILWSRTVVFNLFCSRTPKYNLSSTLYPQSCWCIIQVIYIVYNLRVK